MQIKGDGSIVMVDKGVTRAKCRHWKLKVRTDRGIKEKRFTGTYTDAKAALAHYKASLVIPQGEMPFAEYARRWLERRIRSNSLRKQTIDKDKSHVGILGDLFAGCTLGSLTPSLIMDRLYDMRDKREWGNTYMNAVFAKMKTILEAAVDDGEIAENPMRKLKAPRPDKTDRKALSEDALWGFLRIVQSMPIDSHTVGVQLAVLTGMRRGELCGLEWGDIVKGVAHVSRTVDESGDVFDGAKTASGIRAIPIPAMMKRALDAWKVVQEEQLASINVRQTVKTPVLTSAVGTRMNPQNLARWWRNSRDSFGLPGVVLHELRHTYATMLANQGAPSQVLKSVLGWASINMADTYVHDDEGANGKVVKTLSDYIDRGVTSGVTSNVTSEPCCKAS